MIILNSHSSKKFKILPHPPNNPDIAPSDYHMFGPLKEALHGCRFASDEVKNAMHMWLRSKPKNFLACKITRLANCYTILREG